MDVLLLNRLVHARIAECPANSTVVILVDPGDISAIALIVGVGVQPAFVIEFAAKTHCHDRLLEVKRAHRLHVHGAPHGLRRKGGIGCLVDRRTRDQFGRELVILDSTVVVRRNEFATVQHGRREVGCQAADRNLVGTTVEALRRQAGQPCQRLAYRSIRQFTDVFGKDGLDDTGRIAFGRNRVPQARAVARRDDFFNVFVVGVLCHRDLRSGHHGARQCRCDGQRDGRTTDV